MKLAAFLLFTLGALAQDNFEIQVYEWETVPKGRWNLETHLNFVAKGTKEWDGPVAPNNQQTHLTYELTHGITEHFELAGYLVLAVRPGVPSMWEYAGARIRPRVSLPKEWGLPVDVSISAEFGFPRKVYEENSVTFELRPIFEKKIGHWQFDVNPTFTRALRGPTASEGWGFEPAVRVAYELNKRFEPSFEYYGGISPLSNLPPAHEQAHLFYPGCDIHLRENVVWNLGIGWAATPVGEQFVIKTRLGVEFGRHRQ